MTLRYGNALVAIVLFLFVFIMLALAIFSWSYSANVIFFPAVSGGLVIIASGWLFARSFIAKTPVLDQESEPFEEGNSRCTLLKRALWLGSIYPLLYTFGFLVGLIALSLAYTSYHRLPWWQRLLTAVIIFAFAYVGFVELLGVPLPIEPVWLRE